MTAQQFNESVAHRGFCGALVYQGFEYSYTQLGEWIDECDTWLRRQGIKPDMVVALQAESSPMGLGMLVALWMNGTIVVPVSSDHRLAAAELIAEAEAVVKVGRKIPEIRFTRSQPSFGLYDQLRSEGQSGTVLFSSGTSAEPKAIVHRTENLLNRHARPGRADRTAGFLTMDHIGGLNTLLYVLSNGGCLIPMRDRSPHAVAAMIEAFRVEVLPVTPTFLRLLLIDGIPDRYDLSSLKLITYGSEPMSAVLLEQCQRAFPHVEFLQQYGMSELGVLRSRCRADGWMKLGGAEFETRVIDGELQVRSPLSMLGYLNADSPFTEDGWLRTGDQVEVDGEYVRVLGRTSEVLNIGGEKVPCSAIEEALEAMQGVEFAVVQGEPHPLVGTLVSARVQLSGGETVSEFRTRMRVELKSALPNYMIPQRVEFATQSLVGSRAKKQRTA